MDTMTCYGFLFTTIDQTMGLLMPFLQYNTLSANKYHQNDIFVFYRVRHTQGQIAVWEGVNNHESVT